jgi:hypothetical protein
MSLTTLLCLGTGPCIAGDAGHVRTSGDSSTRQFQGSSSPDTYRRRLEPRQLQRGDNASTRETDSALCPSGASRLRAERIPIVCRMPDGGDQQLTVGSVSSPVELERLIPLHRCRSLQGLRPFRHGLLAKPHHVAARRWITRRSRSEARNCRTGYGRPRRCRRDPPGASTSGVAAWLPGTRPARACRRVASRPSVSLRR